MPELVLDEEFKSLMTPLTADERRTLEESVVADGCRDPLVVWGGILVDGHNRHEICKRHNIPFKTIKKKFPSRHEALNWIINNQLGRRNLTPELKTYFVGKKYNSEKKAVTNPTGKNQHAKKEVGHQNDDQPPCDEKKTADLIAEKLKISTISVQRAGKWAAAVDKISESAGSDIRDKIFTRDIKLSKKDVQAIADTTPSHRIRSVILKQAALQAAPAAPRTTPNVKQPPRHSKTWSDLDPVSQQLLDAIYENVRTLKYSEAAEQELIVSIAPLIARKFPEYGKHISGELSVAHRLDFVSAELSQTKAAMVDLRQDNLTLSEAKAELTAELKKRKDHCAKTCEFTLQGEQKVTTDYLKYLVTLMTIQCKSLKNHAETDAAKDIKQHFLESVFTVLGTLDRMDFKVSIDRNMAALFIEFVKLVDAVGIDMKTVHDRIARIDAYITRRGLKPTETATIHRRQTKPAAQQPAAATA